MSKWAQPVMDRRQRLLLAPSLDEQLGATHGLRLLDEWLNTVDWSPWEQAYVQAGPGRPPLHPRLLAGAILYGLLKRIHSTRELEEATRMRLDFRWWLEGRTVDHTTFSYFRTQFEPQIRELFQALNRRAKELKRATLEEILIDGTRLRADSDRHGARTAATLAQRLQALDVRMAEALAQLRDEPAAEVPPTSEGEVRAELARLDAQRQQLEAALQAARARDAQKQRKDGAGAEPVRVPVTDPDAYILPNKEGGYAPNYTPVAAVDAASGLIVAAEVAEGHHEAATVPALVQQVQALDPAHPPARVLFDSGFASGVNLAHLAETGMDVYAPVIPHHPENPAPRADLTQPVPAEQRAALPLHGQKLDRTAFVYQPEQDQFRCPMGRALLPARSAQRPQADGSRVTVTTYQCTDCSACPLAPQCLGREAQTRTVCRDEHEPLREQVRARMQTPEGKQIYARRAPFGEGVFAVIKQHMGIRRFTRRGHAKVAADWLWICVAYNLKKLLRGAPTAPHTPRSTPPRRGRGVLAPPLWRSRRVSQWCWRSVPAWQAA